RRPDRRARTGPTRTGGRLRRRRSSGQAGAWHHLTRGRRASAGRIHAAVSEDSRLLYVDVPLGHTSALTLVAEGTTHMATSIVTGPGRDGEGSGPTYDVVVLAASAGGLGAPSTIPRRPPRGFPAAILVIMHLPSASALAEILARATPLDVRWADEG